jgi:O-antigen/teichoic acid export membrane protein
MTTLAVRSRLADPLLRNSLAIMATSLVTSLLGYVFWLVVAHTSTAAVTGAGAAATSALQATALFASVGAAASMIEWLPRTRSALEWRQRHTAGFVVAAGGALLGSLVTVAVLGHLLGTLPALASVEGGLLFTLGTVAFALGTLVDYVAVAEKRGGRMLLRNVLFTGLRIPLVLVPLVTDHILAAWAVAGVLSLGVGLLGFRGFAFGALGAHLLEMRHSLVGQHLITITAMLTTYVLPILVVARVSAEANAYFYATWMLGSVFFMISPAVSTSLFAETVGPAADLRALTVRCIKIVAALVVLPMVAYLAGGGLLLRMFGPDYPAAGQVLLVLLTLSVVPDAVTNIAVAVLRSTGRIRVALRLNVLMLAGCLAASWLLLPVLGIVAVGWAWIGAQLLGAAWVLARWKWIVG